MTEDINTSTKYGCNHCKDSGIDPLIYDSYCTRCGGNPPVKEDSGKN